MTLLIAICVVSVAATIRAVAWAMLALSSRRPPEGDDE